MTDSVSGASAVALDWKRDDGEQAEQAEQAERAGFSFSRHPTCRLDLLKPLVALTA